MSQENTEFLVHMHPMRRWHIFLLICAPLQRSSAVWLLLNNLIFSSYVEIDFLMICSRIFVGINVTLTHL